MRGTLATTLVLLAPLLAGCLVPNAGDDGRRGGGSERFTQVDAPPIGFHGWSTCGLCHGGRENPEQRLFFAFEDGRAILVHHNPTDGPREVSFDRGVAYDRAQLRSLLAGIEGDPLWRHGGVWVGKVETARLSPGAHAVLWRALNESWEKPPERPSDCADCVGPGTYGRATPSGAWDTFSVQSYAHGHPEAEAFEQLDRAFRQAQAVFDASRAPTPSPPVITTPPPDATATPPPTPTQRPWEMTQPATPECVRLDARASPSEVARGEGANLSARLANLCDREIQIQGTSGCALDGLDAAILDADGTRFWLTKSGAAHELRACTAIMPGAVTIPPHGTHDAWWLWNGTLARHRDAGCCTDYAAPDPGELRIVVEIVLPDGLPNATATLRVAPPPE